MDVSRSATGRAARCAGELDPIVSRPLSPPAPTLTDASPVPTLRCEIAAWMGSMVHPRAGEGLRGLASLRESTRSPPPTSSRAAFLSGQRWPLIARPTATRRRGIDPIVSYPARRGPDSAIEGRQRGVSSCSSSPARRRARSSAGNPRLRVRYSERTTTAPSTPRTPLGYEHRPTDSRLDWGF